MAQQFDKLNQGMIKFIEKQKIYFVGTATDTSRVNVSPKGYDTLRIIDENTAAWLSVTGSGNETAGHLRTHPRMTIMFTAFEGPALILRLYGQAKAIHRNDPEWDKYIELFPPLPAARQIYLLDIDMVQTSCGLGTPFFDFKESREELNDKHHRLGHQKIEEYWEAKNQKTIDGIETDIVARNL